MTLSPGHTHLLRDRYANLVLEKLRHTLVTRDNYIFNNRYEGDPKAGAVKIPVRDTEVAVRTYNTDTGVALQDSGTSYEPLNIDQDRAVNEIIDGYEASAVPDGIVAERLDSAGYALALDIDTQGLNLLVNGTVAAPRAVATDKVISTKETIFTKIVAARTALGNKKIPNQGMFLIVPPETMGLLLLSEEFIKAGDLSQELVAAGVVGRIAGFNVFESNNIPKHDPNDTNLDVEFIAGHPNWIHRVMEWKVEPYVQSLDGDAAYIGASAVKGRLVWGQLVSRADAVYVKVGDRSATPPVDRSYVVTKSPSTGKTTSIIITFNDDVDLDMDMITFTDSDGADVKANLKLGDDPLAKTTPSTVWTITTDPTANKSTIVTVLDSTEYNFVAHANTVDVKAS